MAFFFLLLYLVVIYLRPAEWVPAFYGWQLVDLTTIGTALFLAFSLAATKRRLVSVPHTRMLLGLFAAAALSHVVHAYLGGTITAIVDFGEIFIMYFLMVNVIRTERQLKIALALFVILTALLAVQGIQQHQTGYGWAGQSLSEGTRICWISIFSDPNDLSLAFVIVVPLLLSGIVGPAFFGLKVVPVGLLGLVLYGIYLANSRGGILALMAAVTFFFVKRSRWVVPGGIIGGTFATLVFLFGPSRMGALSAEEASAQGRLDAWYYGFQLIKANPLFGVGHNLFTDAYVKTAHNSFVLAAAELGMVGLFCWVGLFYVSFKGLSRIQKHCPRLASLAYGLQAALVGFLASAMFLSRTYNELPYLLCALAAALYHIGRTQSPSVEFAFSRRDVRNIVLLALGSLGLVHIAMKTWL